MKKYMWLSKINFSKAYYILSMIFAFVLPLSRAGISFMMFFLLILWIFEMDFKRKYNQIINSKLNLTIIFFFLFSVVSMLWTTNQELGWLNILKTFYLFIIIILSTSIEKKYLPNIITAFLMGMFISEIIAYGVFFEFWTFKKATVSNPSPFMQHIHYSLFLATTSILLLNRLFSKIYSIKEKLFLFFFFLTVTGNLFLSTGRTGQVGLIAGIIVMVIIHFRFSIKSIFITILLIGTIYTTAYNISNSFKARVADAISDIQKMQKLDFSSSWGIRAAFWILSYDAVLNNPMGYGVGDYKIAIKEQLDTNKYPYIRGHAREFMQNAHPHNQYLKILLQFGIVGFGLFIFMIYNIFKLKIKDKDTKEFSILFGVVYFTSCIAEPLLGLFFPVGLFVFFIGIFASNETNHKLNKNRIFDMEKIDD